MLAVVQLWPMVFGHHIMPTTPARAADVRAATQLITPSRAVASQMVPAVVERPAAKTLPATGKDNPIGCYQRYQIAYRECRSNDGGCRMGAADKWDLCEATGFWKE
ncbi:hypothetical protein ACLB0R_14160 [Sphingomonas sp. GlSt437]|uniref:hypothetical protein n=1 Tax=Sphingomonas sp. GlSt437 TaxID=3389970 RepID=UPI003A83DE89